MQLGMEQGWSPTRPTSMESCAAEYRGISSSVNGLYGSSSSRNSVRNSCSGLTSSSSDTPSAYHYPYYSPTEPSQTMEELSPHVAGGVSSPWSSASAADHHRSAAAAAARQYNPFGNVSPSFLTAATAQSSHPSHHHHQQQYLSNGYSSAYNFHNSAYPLHDMTGEFISTNFM